MRDMSAQPGQAAKRGGHNQQDVAVSLVQVPRMLTMHQTRPMARAWRVPFCGPTLSRAGES
jgi:hypothetical protein